MVVRDDSFPCIQCFKVHVVVRLQEFKLRGGCERHVAPQLQGLDVVVRLRVAGNGVQEGVFHLFRRAALPSAFV